MAVETPKRIHLLGCGRHEEAMAGIAGLLPGKLVRVTGLADNPHPELQVNLAPAGEDAYERLFVLEDALQGKTIADAYAVDDVVALVIACPGDVVYAFVEAGAEYSAGDLLEAAGSGNLGAQSTGVPLGVLVQDLDLSASDAVDTRARIRVL